ncbi:hypothetical protein CR513_23343, partial [Mucuna pruriens]
MARNSASALNRATTFFFLLLQVIDFLLETYSILRWIFYPQSILHSTLEILHPNFPIEYILPLGYATLIPMKYFSFPNSFFSNCIASFSFRFSFSISSS